MTILDYERVSSRQPEKPTISRWELVVLLSVVLLAAVAAVIAIGPALTEPYFCP